MPEPKGKKGTPLGTEPNTDAYWESFGYDMSRWGLGQYLKAIVADLTNRSADTYKEGKNPTEDTRKLSKSEANEAVNTLYDNIRQMFDTGNEEYQSLPDWQSFQDVYVGANAKLIGKTIYSVGGDYYQRDSTTKDGKITYFFNPVDSEYAKQTIASEAPDKLTAYQKLENTRAERAETRQARNDEIARSERAQELALRSQEQQNELWWKQYHPPIGGFLPLGEGATLEEQRRAQTMLNPSDYAAWQSKKLEEAKERTRTSPQGGGERVSYGNSPWAPAGWQPSAGTPIPPTNPANLAQAGYEQMALKQRLQTRLTRPEDWIERYKADQIGMWTPEDRRAGGAKELTGVSPYSPQTPSWLAQFAPETPGMPLNAVYRESAPPGQELVPQAQGFIGNPLAWTGQGVPMQYAQAQPAKWVEPTPYRFETPSAQKFATISPEQQQMLAGYVGWLGDPNNLGRVNPQQPSWADVMYQMYAALPNQPRIAQYWKPTRQK